MIESYRRFWHNILNFSGTSNRADYWWPMIINYVLGIVLTYVVQKMLGHPINGIKEIRIHHAERFVSCRRLNSNDKLAIQTTKPIASTAKLTVPSPHV